MEKLIVTAAITGSATPPSSTPYLPITPEQIADQAVEASEAGAAVVHIHARDPESGMPSSDLNIFRKILTSIKEKSDVIVCTSTGGGAGMTAEERIAVVPEFKPEMASFNMGSMNFSFPKVVIERLKPVVSDWEKMMLDMSRDFVFKNTFADLEHFCKTMLEHNTKPELEIYDAGHLYNAYSLLREKTLKLPLHMQYVMGVYGGIGSGIEDLLYLKSTADRLFGKDNYTWSVIGIGYPAEFQLGTASTMIGGHVRVGLEDNIFIEKGKLAESNAELVAKMVRIVKELGREIATPNEARKMLGLKGKDKVKF